MYGRVFWGVRCIVFVWQVRSVHFSGRFNKRLATNGILQGFRRNPASRVPTRLTPRQRNNHSQCTFTHLGRRRRIIQSFRRTLIAGWNKWRVSFITSAHLCLLQSSISKGGETCRPSRFVSFLLILHKWKSPPVNGIGGNNRRIVALQENERNNSPNVVHYYSLWANVVNEMMFRFNLSRLVSIFIWDLFCWSDAVGSDVYSGAFGIY